MLLAKIHMSVCVTMNHNNDTQQCNLHCNLSDAHRLINVVHSYHTNNHWWSLACASEVADRGHSDTDQLTARQSDRLSVCLSLISVSHSWRHSRMPLIQLMGRLSQLYLCHLILPPPTPLTTQQLTPKLTLVLYPCLQTRSVFAVLSRICIFWFTDHFVLTVSQALLILWAFKIRVMLLGSLVSQVTPYVPKI